MQNFSIIVIGGSAGGLDALKRLTPRLPADLNAAICLVLHISPDSPGLIAEILTHFGTLPATAAQHGEKLRPGRIFVAPPNRHLLIEQSGALRLGTGPKENMFKPAIDPLFRSAAVFGSRVVGVILSGGLDDGAAGLATLKAAGAKAIVQDPNDAIVGSMPRAALRAAEVDHCLSAESIADCLARLVPALGKTPTELVMPDRITEMENQIAAGAASSAFDLASLGEPSTLTCPHCDGVLFERSKSPLRFRCHTGHAYSAETLTALVAERLDDTLWSALRAAQEQQMLLSQLANGGEASAETLAAVAEQAEQVADELRDLIALKARTANAKP